MASTPPAPVIYGHGSNSYVNQNDEKNQVTDGNNGYLLTLGGMALGVRVGLRPALFPLPGNGTGQPYKPSNFGAPVVPPV